jgi:hypothetical protein
LGAFDSIILFFKKYLRLSDIRQDIAGVLSEGYARISSFVKSFINLTGLNSAIFSPRTPRMWITRVFVISCILSAGLAISGYMFARCKFRWFVVIWDQGVLPLYAFTHFNHSWWLVMCVLMLVLWFIIGPWRLRHSGYWDKQLRIFNFSYMPIFCLFLVFSWIFQPFLGVKAWFFAIGLFIIAHTLLIYGLGILKSIANRLPEFNKRYIEKTRRKFIEGAMDQALISPDEKTSQVIADVEEEDDVDDVPEKTPNLAGNLIRKPIGMMVHDEQRARLLTRMKQNIQNRILSAIAWINVKLVRDEYYVMHYEMVALDLVDREKEKSWDDFLTHQFEPALKDCATQQLFKKL